MNFILFGNFVYTDNLRNLIIKENMYAVCENGVSQGIFSKIPEEYAHFELKNHENKLILPGLIDLHVHAPQYEFRATAMDMELIDWLNTYTFPTESKYKDVDYAKKAYSLFASHLKKSPTTRAVIFGTIHKQATIKLMELLDETGLKTYVGKVNMDRNSPDFYIEDTISSINDTNEFILACNFENSKPIITPRFIPTCTDELMHELSKLSKEYDLPIQSHLSENIGEIKWVSELCPESKFYGDAYDKFSMFNDKTIMAHVVLPCEEEIALLKKNGVFVAHCPSSNLNLTSGIAPVRRILDEGISIGFGSDVAGGNSLSIFNEMMVSIQMSKMYKRYVDSTKNSLSIADVLYMATLGGGKFFGNVGSFDSGYEFDAIIIDDKNLQTTRNFNITERLERLIYNSFDSELVEKYVAGIMIKI